VIKTLLSLGFLVPEFSHNRLGGGGGRRYNEGGVGCLKSSGDNRLDEVYGLFKTKWNPPQRELKLVYLRWTVDALGHQTRREWYLNQVEDKTDKGGGGEKRSIL